MKNNDILSNLFKAIILILLFPFMLVIAICTGKE